MLSLSVITPSFNQGEFIERTLQSVLNQSIKPLEYFVFDGQSTDDTIAILKQYESQLTWISEPDHGQAHAVNKGLKMVQGDVIGWLNSDDMYYPEAFNIVLTFFEQHPDVDIIYGKAHNIDKADQFIETYPTEPWCYERLKSICFLSQPAVFFRRDVIAQYGLLNEKLHYCMDYEYWLRLAKKGAHFAHIPLVLAGARIYAETKTISQRVAVHAEINTMLHDTLGYTPNRWLSNYAIVWLEARGMKATQEKQFMWRLIAMKIYASLRWNKQYVLSTLRKKLIAWKNN